MFQQGRVFQANGQRGQSGQADSSNSHVFFNQQLPYHQRAQPPSQFSGAHQCKSSTCRSQSFSLDSMVESSSSGGQPRRPLVSRPSFPRPPRRPKVVVDFQKLPLPRGEVSLNPEVLPDGARRARSPVVPLNPIAPGANEILADKDRVFCHCVRYVEKSPLCDSNYTFKYRDSDDRMIKVSVVVGGDYADDVVDAKASGLEDGALDDVDEEGFGDLLFDSRHVNGVNSKFHVDKRRVLDFLADMVDGPNDLANLKRIRFVCSSLQMYDTVDQPRSPGELALFEFNFQNGIVDTMHSFMRSANKLTEGDKHRLTSFKQANMLDAEMASRGPRFSSVAYEVFCRLQPLEAAAQYNEKRGIYASTGFVDLIRSVLPNLMPEHAQSLWNRTSDQCPILAGPWGRRWIFVLDHELDVMRHGFAEMAKVLESSLNIKLDLRDDRFILLSAFISALAEFLEIEVDEGVVEKLRLLGTERAREFDPETTSLCSFHESSGSFCCAYNSAFGMCNTLDRSFRSKFRNEMLPDLEEFEN